jgi:hypothetical protein
VSCSTPNRPTTPVPVGWRADQPGDPSTGRAVTMTRGSSGGSHGGAQCSARPPTRSAPSPIPLCRNGKGLADKRYFSETALLLPTPRTHPRSTLRPQRLSRHSAEPKSLRRSLHSHDSTSAAVFTVRDTCYRSRMPANSTYALTTHTAGSTHVRQRRQSTRHCRRPGYCCSSRRSRSAPAFCP